MSRGLPTSLLPGLALLLVALAPGCGLFQAPIDFRSYPLDGIPYDEVVVLVDEVTRDVFQERFGGGYTVDWDEPGGNMIVRGVEEGNRRLTMYIHLEPVGGGDEARLEMFALVQTLADQLSAGGGLWTSPQVDVTFEEILYRAYLLEAMDRGLLSSGQGPGAGG